MCVFAMNLSVKTVNLNSVARIETDEIIRALIHELQNHLRNATMELELTELGVAERVDAVKLLRILDSFKHSLQALRECILPSEDDLTREDPTAILGLGLVLADLGKKLPQRKINLRLVHGGPMPTVELNKE
jgi:hypothetical protein